MSVKTDDPSQIEKLCVEKGMRMTAQRRIIARVLSVSTDHPNVEELYSRCADVDSNISIATVYRTVRLFEEADILVRRGFSVGGRARYEQAADSQHDHLIDVKNGKVVEFADDDVERLLIEVAEKLGYRLVERRIELFGVLIDDDGSAGGQGTSPKRRVLGKG